MISSSSISILAGVSSLFAVLCLLAYFLIGRESGRPSLVPSDEIQPNVVTASGQFKSESAKNRFFDGYFKYSGKIASGILAKSKPIDLQQIILSHTKSHDLRFIVTAFFFGFLAIVALVFALKNDPTTKDHVAAATFPIPAQVPHPAPVYEDKWVATRPGGTPYFQGFPVQTQNRHKESQVGKSETISTQQLKDPIGLEKRIIGAKYSCSGIDHRCDWSKNYQGGSDGQYEISSDKQSITWFRSWDGDPVDEVNTVFYEVFQRVCKKYCE
ncbi:MAG TPA: hypothetical protein VN089_26195 [Duganella sp.]|nr:hypothetical protein [Duganella sp.]